MNQNNIFSVNITLTMYQSCRAVMQGVYANSPNITWEEIPAKFDMIREDLEDLAYQHNLAYYPKEDTYCSIDRLSLLDDQIDLSSYDNQKDVEDDLLEWSDSLLTDQSFKVISSILSGDDNRKRQMIRGLLFKTNLGTCLITRVSEFVKKDPEFLSFVGNDDMSKFTSSLFFNFAWDSIVNFERVLLQYENSGSLKEIWIRPIISSDNEGCININNIDFVVRDKLY